MTPAQRPASSSSHVHPEEPTDPPRRSDSLVAEQVPRASTVFPLQRNSFSILVPPCTGVRCLPLRWGWVSDTFGSPALSSAPAERCPRQHQLAFPTSGAGPGSSIRTGLLRSGWAPAPAHSSSGRCCHLEVPLQPSSPGKVLGRSDFFNSTQHFKAGFLHEGLRGRSR